MISPLRALRLCLALAMLAGCASTPPPTAALPPPPVHANGQALWRIIDGQCVPGEVRRSDPAPCVSVSMKDRVVVLKDREGVAQYLLMPTDKVTGIEDPKILAKSAPNYFALAWAAGRYVDAKMARPLPRADLSVAVNSVYGRSQDQLHLHVDCLDAGVGAALAAAAPHIGREWSAHPYALAGQTYYVRRIDGEPLTVSPFRLLAAGMPGAAQAMGAWTLVLAGETSKAGVPGYYLIAGRADPAKDQPGSGEQLQDHACKGHALAG